MREQVVKQISIDAIKTVAQVRETSGLGNEEIVGLAQSIKETGGILEPLLVRREADDLILLAGHRRLLAARLVGLESVPAIIEEAELSDADITHRQLVLEMQKVSCNPIERARWIARYMEQTQCPAAQVAVKLGVSPANVSKLLALLELSDDQQIDVASGKLAMSTAYGLARVSDESLRESLATEASQGKLTRDALNRKIRRVQRGDSANSSSAAVRVTAALDGGRSVTVNGKGLTIETMIDWLEQLLSKARKAHSQGLELPTFIKMLRNQSRSAKGAKRC